MDLARDQTPLLETDRGNGYDLLVATETSVPNLQCLSIFTHYEDTKGDVENGGLDIVRLTKVDSAFYSPWDVK